METLWQMPYQEELVAHKLILHHICGKYWYVQDLDNTDERWQMEKYPEQVYRLQMQIK